MDTYGYNGNQSQTAYGRAFGNQPSAMPPSMQQLPHYEVKRVDGENGAWSIPMGPNSSLFVADNQKEDRIWLIMTDGAGYRTVRPIKATFEDIVTQQNIQETLMLISDRLARLEEKYDGEQLNSRSSKQRNARASANPAVANGVAGELAES